MKLVVSTLALAAACTGIASAGPLPRGHVRTHGVNVMVKPNSFIVEFHDEATGAQAELIRGMASVAVGHQFDGLFKGMSVNVDDAVTAEHLAGIDGVKTVYPNRIHTLDTRAGTKNITSPYLHTMTGAATAWNKMGLTGKGVSIAIIDTGVDYLHPDLGRCWKGAGCPWQKGRDLVGDKYDPRADKPILKPNPTPLDQCNGHGTHVAGILMARGDLVHGVARDATYGMYRVFGCPTDGNDPSTADDIILKAILAAHQDGHDIISMSLGSTGWDDSPVAALASKLVAKGVVVVASAGNSGQDGLLTAGAPAVGKGVVSVGSVENWYITGSPLNVATGSGTQSLQKWDGEQPDQPFLFDKATPVVAVKDATGSPLVCGPVSQSLAGKIALVQRGSCSFDTKAQFVEKAGAVGLLLVDTGDEPVNPSVYGEVKIPIAMLRKQDGDSIAASIRQGPVTITASPYVYNTFPGDHGGQMSTFSSYGPTPQLSMVPMLSAPGGNIWSTFPQKLGSYKSLSGTSMAAPYAAGAVALLKQGRPDLTPAELRMALMTTSKPVINERTGKKSTPLQSGSGLINIADALRSRALISPSFIAINDTAYEPHPDGNPAAAHRKITITNTDKKRAAQLQTFHLIADSVTMFYPNGSLTAAALNGTPLDTWPPNTQAVPPNSQPQIACDGCLPTIAPGASITFKVRITRPTDLAKSGRWFYGGFFDFRLKWAGDSAFSSHVLPYTGYNGNYRDIPVLPPAAEGLPMFTDMESAPLPNQAAVKVTAKQPALYAFSLSMPSRAADINLITATGKSVGYLPNGCMRDLARALPSEGLYSLLVNGMVTTDCAGTKSVKVAPGKYRVKLAVLKLFGNPAHASDYETRISKEITIA